MGRPRKDSAHLAVPVEDPAAPSAGARKRGRPSLSSRPSSAASGDVSHGPGSASSSPRMKKGRQGISPRPPLELGFRHNRGCGVVLSVGQGDTGQLGLGEDVMEKSRPQVVSGIKDAVDCVAGGMHTAVLDMEGRVWTFGCNDEGSLGRVVEEEEECFLPGQVTLPSKVVMLSCGDSHTAALTQSGEVWAWGTFRDNSGPIGLTESGVLQKVPQKVLAGVEVKKIASGSDHIVMLSRDGDIYTMGNGEQGQLGRIMEKFAQRGGRRGIDTFLTPAKIHIKSRFGAFVEVWAGSYNTVAVTESGDVMVCGLNNYNQMGLAEGLTFYMPVVSPDLSKRRWQGVAIGQHHAVAQETGGSVWSIGRSEYGRLGLGEEGARDAKVAEQVAQLEGCVEVACGTAVSYAVTGAGKLYSWGMGTNGQLGTGEEDDVWQPFLVNSKQLQTRDVIVVSSGGQHSVMIAKDRQENGENMDQN